MKHYYLQIKKFIDYIQIKGYFSAKISCIAQVTFNVTLNKYLCLGTGMFFLIKYLQVLLITFFMMRNWALAKKIVQKVWKFLGFLNLSKST